MLSAVSNEQIKFNRGCDKHVLRSAQSRCLGPQPAPTVENKAKLNATSIQTVCENLEMTALNLTSFHIQVKLTVSQAKC